MNENFFDFSAGFESFGIFTPQDAAMLEAAAIGQKNAPAGLQFSQVATPLNPGSDPGVSPPDAVNPGSGQPVADAGTGSDAGADPAKGVPGAPAPPLLLLVAGAGILALHHALKKKQAQAAI